MEDEGGLFKKMKRILTGQKEQERVAEEIMSMVDEGHDKGVFAGSEAEMIRNIFEYGEKDAKDIMTHRKSIVALNGEDTVEVALCFILEQSNSRFPVYQGDIDTIIGTLHLRDVVSCYFNEVFLKQPLKELVDYIRPVSFVPETKSIDSLFKQMQSEKNHMAIVVDEYGQTSGLVTMEDIIEEIVGNILDEYDDEEVLLTKLSDGTYRAKGMLELADLEEELHISFDKEEFGTLNGFLVSMLEHIPTQEEHCEVTYQGYRFTMLSVSNNMIQHVKIEAEKAREAKEQKEEGSNESI